MRWIIFRTTPPVSLSRPLDIRAGEVEADTMQEALALAGQQYPGPLRAQSVLSLAEEEQERSAFGLTPRWRWAKPGEEYAPAPVEKEKSAVEMDPLQKELERVARIKRAANLRAARQRAKRDELIARAKAAREAKQA